MALCSTCGAENPDAASYCRQCGGELPHEDPLLGQEVLGRYRVSRLIGEGGMGRVYEAEQRVGTTTRRVAVKTLRPQLSADPQLARRFFREAETLVRLSHPNLIQFFDFGEIQQGMLAIVMEFIEGSSLAQEAAQGPLEPARVDLIFKQICGALAEAHALGIVHRDLKPDNILLTRRGGQEDFVKVLDFGIAKLSAAEDEHSTKLTQQGMMVGTPPYMSPEQFSGDPIDARSDIYSLGVIAYEVLTGRLPFDARTPWEWASKHMTAEPEPIRIALGSRAAASGVSEQRAQAIRHALAKRPEQRPESVGAFFAEFSGTQVLAAAREPSAAAGPSLEGALPRSVKAQGTPARPGSVQLPGLGRAGGKGLWLAGAAVALTGIFAAAIFGWLSSESSPAAPAPGERAALPEPPALPQAAPPETLRPAHAAGELSARPSRPSSGARSGGGGSMPSVPRSAERTHAGSTPVDRERALNTPPRRAGDLADPRHVALEPAVGAAPPPAPPPAAVAPAIRPTLPAPRAPAPAPRASTSDPAAADLQARVDRALALAPQRVEVALGLYQAAAARYGPTQPALVPLRTALTHFGDARVRELLAAGHCAQAQAFVRALTQIDADRGARRYFDGSCPAP
jgi:serine/threonine-protein kinase